MKPTLKTVMKQLIAEHGARGVLRADSFDDLSSMGAKVLLARKPATELLAAVGVKVGKGEDAEHVATELLVKLGSEPPPRRISRKTAEGLARKMLLALADDEASAEVVAATLVGVCGQEVLAVTWDGGGLGQNGVETIQRIGKAYWYNGDGGTLGPEPTLNKAARMYVAELTAATQAIRSPELTVDQLVRLFKVTDYVEPGHKVTINGKPFVLNEKRKLEPASKGKRR